MEEQLPSLQGTLASISSMGVEGAGKETKTSEGKKDLIHLFKYLMNIYYYVLRVIL